MRIYLGDVVGSSGKVEAHIVLHSEDVPWNHVPSPTVAGTTINMTTFLAYLLANPAALAASGYLGPCNHQTGCPGTTQWNHVLAAAAEVGADPALKTALGNPVAPPGIPNLPYPLP